jgi:ABC-type transport system involved in cytochrome bd biosynthesis fused ATPase/permease subunit
MVSIDVLALVFGAIYGYMNPGKEDKLKILKNGLKWGLIIGIVLGVLNLLLGGGLLLSGAGIVGTVIAVVYLTIFFIIGAFIGDFLEGILKK